MSAIPKIFLDADQAGIRLETTAGVPTWEAWPSFRHQKTAQAIFQSITHKTEDPERCACLPMLDVYVKFPDGSLKRPDLAIFCEEPPEDEQDGAVNVIPEAVVEILSPGYEQKDLAAVAFYQAAGIRDVIIYDPRALTGTHHHQGGSDAFQAPWRVTLACGCGLEV